LLDEGVFRENVVEDLLYVLKLFLGLSRIIGALFQNDVGVFREMLWEIQHIVQVLFEMVGVVPFQTALGFEAAVFAALLPELQLNHSAVVLGDAEHDEFPGVLLVLLGGHEVQLSLTVVLEHLGENFVVALSLHHRFKEHLQQLVAVQQPVLELVRMALVV